MGKEHKHLTRKAIFRVNYKPSLEFFDGLYKSKKLFENFPNWKTDGLHLTLYDYEKHHSLKIEFDNVVFESDEYKESEVEKVIQLIEAEKDIVATKETKRMGLRLFSFVPTELKFDELVEILNLKIYNQDLFSSILMPADNSSTFIFDLKNDIHCRFFVCPIKESEVPRFVPLNIQDHFNEKLNERLKKIYDVLNSYPPISLFCDMDFYTTKAIEWSTFYKKASASFDEIMKKAKSYILKEKL